MTVSIGDTVRCTTRDHGHLAPARVKSFTGTVFHVASGTASDGREYTVVGIKVAPAFKSTRYFNTRMDNVEVVA